MRVSERLANVAMKHLLTLSCLLLPTALFADPPDLDVLNAGYPRAYFFRSAEGVASNPRVAFERFDADFSRLMGIQGKVLDEEIPGRSRRNIGAFTRFKKAHPRQLVLLHFNGNARDPRFDREEFHPAHFLYFEGTRILDDVSAEPGETEIRVADAERFQTDMGRFKTDNDDIGLCMLDERGRPDWSRSEQVRLVSVDPKRKTIRVRRGCYGTEPRAFPKGKAYAAAHVVEGPWGRKSHLLWVYNYSTRCPRDAEGRTCGDVLAADLARRFSPDGELAAFDGIQFDVLHNHPLSRRGTGADCDADGKADRGMFEGVNTYGAGVIEFCRGLREKLGKNRLILADGMSLGSQRAFGLLNGIESEGFPRLNDWELRDWSSGLNRHFYWRDHAAEPVFNYINHKFTTAGEKPGSRVRPDVPFGIHRLVFAAAVFTDSAVCYSFTPPKPRGRLIGVWDELVGGTLDRPGWLGMPLGPPVRLAAEGKDLLQSSPEFRVEASKGTQVRRDANGWHVTTEEGTDAPDLRLRLKDIPCNGPDLFVRIRAHGDPLRGHPREMARLMETAIAPPEGMLVAGEPPQTGMAVRGKPETELDRAAGAWVTPRRILIGDVAKRGFEVHPPYKKGVGYTFWSREVTVPEEARLRFSTGMGPKSPERSDGVWFRVYVSAADSSDPVVGGTKVFEHVQKAHRWEDHEVSLKPWSGKCIRLSFVADCGPHDNSTTDHAKWGGPVLVGPEGIEVWTEPRGFMTWLGGVPFTSAYYFDAVRGESVDLTVRVEGRAPFVIEAIEAYAAPDLIYREFEHGLVFANPSPRACKFDLADRFPGKQFRRIQGTELQDPEFNNGRPAGSVLRLEPMDAVFLRK